MQEGSPPDSDHPAGHGQPAAGAGRSRLILLRAVAGMAFAVAMGSTMVALELAHSMGALASRSQHRLAQLSAKTRALKRDLAAADKELGSAEREVQVFDHLDAILMASDLKLFRLAPRDSVRSVRALVVTSEQLGEAVFAAVGLKPEDPGQVYALWCASAHGEPIKEDEFTVTDGKAMTLADWHKGRGVSQCFVTLEPAAGGGKPSGEIVLQGHSGK
ncbi:MAG: anti-sigma factor [Candidatus Binataceae bacterium]